MAFHPDSTSVNGRRCGFSCFQNESRNVRYVETQTARSTPGTGVIMAEVKVVRKKGEEELLQERIGISGFVDLLRPTTPGLPYRAEGATT